MADNLWMSFIADDPEQIILFCSSPDGSNWGSDYQLSSFWAPETFFESPPAQYSPLAPASAFFNNEIFIAWTGSGNSQVVVCSAPSFSPSFWGQWPEQFLQNQAAAPEPVQQTAIGQTSKTGPSLAVFNNRLYVAFVGTDASQPVLVCSTADGVNWSNYTATGQYSHVAPSLAAYNNRLYVAYVADDGTGNLYVTSSADGANWANNTKTGQSSSLAPSLAVVPFEATDPSNELENNPPQPPDIPGGG